jgi:hypothetical protein
MDNIEGTRDVRPAQRIDQFMRLRDVIEEGASRKFLEEQVQADRPVVLRSNDFIRRPRGRFRCEVVPYPRNAEASVCREYASGAFLSSSSI